MSLSPLVASEPGQDDEAYRAGWSNLSRWIRSGHSWSGHERHCAYQNLGGWREGAGRFADVSFIQGLDLDQDGRAAVPVDWDLDGDQDLWIVSRNEPRLRLMVNQTANSKDFIALRLHGVQANRGAIGARVEVRLEGGARQVLVRSQRAGSGYLAQTGPWLHFGLGAGVIRDVRVLWPGGDWESFGSPARGQFWQLRQGTGQARGWTPPSLPELELNPEPVGRVQNSDSATRLALAIPTPMPKMEVIGLDGTSGEFLGITPGGANGTGRPVLITLWSHTCAPCIGELSDLAAASAVFDEVGLKSVLLCVDPTGEREAVQAALRRTSAAGQAGWVLPGSLAALDALASVAGSRPERLPVPSSFLVDPGGRLQVIYRGRVSPRTVLQDLALIPLDAQIRRLAALPFVGRFLHPAPEENLAWWEGAVRNLGQTTLAANFALGQLDAAVVGEAELHLGFAQARMQEGELSEALRHLERARALNELNPAIWLELGVVYSRQGNPQAAEEALLRALRMEPRSGRANFEWGRILIGRQDAEGVQAQIQRLRSIPGSWADRLSRLWDAARDDLP